MMGYKGRIITTFISLLVGIPYCIYNFISLHSILRLEIDLSVLIAVTMIIYWLGMQYDKADFYHKELMKKQKQLTQMAYYDELTLLPNRSLLYKFLKKSIQQIKLDNKSFVVLFIDLDGFKVVNDEFGHYIGDLLLVEVGSTLKSCISEKDMVARLGGDEFIIVLTDCNKSSAIEIVACVKNKFSKPFILNGRSVQITASIGASISPDDGLDEELLIQRADKAMYEAKNKGKNTVAYYQPSIK
ncbi:GGDEF domain-containing protein [Bacillus sp. T3]|uniref:GGDEF domain-containing protein n=1 Tax=Bacillus sp. T3 TaxID=467262 RepID=UPI002980F1B6|nr:GGDEF domain-containing protein [Bacillus sp. T3]